MALGQMVIAGYTFTINPSDDSDWNYTITQSDFIPLNATDTITQVLGTSSGMRDFQGYFTSDSGYASIQAYFLGAVPIACTDWKGVTFQALIKKLTARYVLDINTGFQTRVVKFTLQNVNS